MDNKSNKKSPYEFTLTSKPHTPLESSYESSSSCSLKNDDIIAESDELCGLAWDSQSNEVNRFNGDMKEVPSDTMTSISATSISALSTTHNAPNINAASIKRTAATNLSNHVVSIMDCGLSEEKKRKLNDERYRPRDSGNNRKKSIKVQETVSRVERWEEMYQRLLDFRKKEGHCMVPTRYEKDRQLGMWVSTQRRHYKNCILGLKTACMTTERAERLSRIGFDWCGKEKSSDLRWDAQFKKMLEFLVGHGHALVPIGSQHFPQLSNWISNQRQDYKALQKGESTSLTEERIELLNSIGFVWEAPTYGLGKVREAFVGASKISSEKQSYDDTGGGMNNGYNNDDENSNNKKSASLSSISKICVATANLLLQIFEEQKQSISLSVSHSELVKAVRNFHQQMCGTSAIDLNENANINDTHRREQIQHRQQQPQLSNASLTSDAYIGRGTDTVLRQWKQQQQSILTDDSQTHAAAIGSRAIGNLSVDHPIINNSVVSGLSNLCPSLPLLPPIHHTTGAANPNSTSPLMSHVDATSSTNNQTRQESPFPREILDLLMQQQVSQAAASFLHQQEQPLYHCNQQTVPQPLPQLPFYTNGPMGTSINPSANILPVLPTNTKIDPNRQSRSIVAPSASLSSISPHMARASASAETTVGIGIDEIGYSKSIASSLGEISTTGTGSDRSDMGQTTPFQLQQQHSESTSLSQLQFLPEKMQKKRRL